MSLWPAGSRTGPFFAYLHGLGLLPIRRPSPFCLTHTQHFSVSFEASAQHSTGGFSEAAPGLGSRGRFPLSRNFGNKCRKGFLINPGPSGSLSEHCHLLQVVVERASALRMASRSRALQESALQKCCAGSQSCRKWKYPGEACWSPCVHRRSVIEFSFWEAGMLQKLAGPYSLLPATGG